MDDLIRRQDVLDAVKKLYVFAPPLLINTILSVPSASTDMSSYSDKLWHLAHERGIREAQRQWIPCSEMLPVDKGVYLVTDDSGSVAWVEKAWFMWCDDGSAFWEYANVTAWMPLPEPYKGGEADV